MDFSQATLVGDVDVQSAGQLTQNAQRGTEPMTKNVVIVVLGVALLLSLIGNVALASFVDQAVASTMEAFDVLERAEAAGKVCDEVKQGLPLAKVPKKS